MEQFITLLDYLLLPFFLIIIFVIARTFRERHYPLGHPWRKYFMTGLMLKMGGALGISMIYQYYYGGGDTYLYWRHAVKINSAIDESWEKWFNLVLHIPKAYDGAYYQYLGRMEWYDAPSEYTVVQIASVIGLTNFTTFLPIAIIFGAICFTGVWALFRTFATKYPGYTKYIAICVLYIPSTILWGSGLFKDTICMGCLGWMTYCAFRLLINRDFNPINIVFLVISFYVVALIKVYILLAFIPALALWVLFTYSHKIGSSGGRFIVKVAVIGASIGGFFIFSQKFASSLGKYSLDRVATTSSVISNYVAYRSGDEGSTYDLGGGLDASIGGMLKKFPAAVNVTLFRPYIWETRKPFQVLSAVEAMWILWITIKVLYVVGLKKTWKTITGDPTIQFFLIFTIVFAFAVGISSGNFGTLSRYRIPCLPFYTMALVIIFYRNQPMWKNILSFKMQG